MRELPDIPGIQADPTSAPRFKRDNNKALASVRMVIFVLVMAVGWATLVSAFFTFQGKEKLVEIFGGKASQSKDVLVQTIQDIQSTVDRLTNDFDELKQSHFSTKKEVDTDKSQQESLVLRIENIEKLMASLEQKIDQQRVVQVEKPIAPAIKKPVNVQPKPQVIVPINLVSIRSMSGTAYVSVREGLDSSDLLTPGDVWHGWTFVDADPTEKVAVFMVDGKRQELRL